jgi:hypothetical protein
MNFPPCATFRPLQTPYGNIAICLKSTVLCEVFNRTVYGSHPNPYNWYSFQLILSRCEMAKRDAPTTPTETTFMGNRTENQTPKELYAACLSKENRIVSARPAEQLTRLLTATLFESHPLFIEHTISYEPLLARLEQRYPFDFSIVSPKRAEFRYTKLLDTLRRLDSGDLRLLCVARWLKQENVCQPHELLPASVLERLLREFRKRERLSARDVLYWNLMTIWLPYFEQLRLLGRGLPKTHRGNREALLKHGFELGAIDAWLTSRSAKAATTSWLAIRKGINARTLENAYSRMVAARRTSRADLK